MRGRGRAQGPERGGPDLLEPSERLPYRGRQSAEAASRGLGPQNPTRLCLGHLSAPTPAYTSAMAQGTMTCLSVLHRHDSELQHVLLMTSALIYRTQIGPCVTISVCTERHPGAKVNSMLIIPRWPA